MNSDETKDRITKSWLGKTGEISKNIQAIVAVLALVLAAGSWVVQALRPYLAPPRLHIGRVEIIPLLNQPVEATTDGIIIVLGEYIPSVEKSVSLQGYAGPNKDNLPEIARWAIDSPSMSEGAGGTITFPVRKGEFWKISASARMRATVRFVPFEYL